ncbi:hypothetical protein LAJ19_16335 (plasmid) [Deinococcus taeanensis]|uniref:hypothetical protein n=1 Tax=Deinococcus taeanensis TaxID=2737050 RepID=UPI001CDB72DD|nr:hypothetical protein [Deinococcus taeanensis]UBV44724.1 hypothetical protein LAJ19_16335 [Deinococcus taeanensis]
MAKSLLNVSLGATRTVIMSALLGDLSGTGFSGTGWASLRVCLSTQQGQTSLTFTGR